jgi:hypothetical protein
MNENIKKFMEKELPTANISNALKAKKDEIYELHISGYAVHQIVKYLKFTYKLVTSRQTLSKFIKEEIKNEK